MYIYKYLYVYSNIFGLLKKKIWYKVQVQYCFVLSVWAQPDWSVNCAHKSKCRCCIRRPFAGCSGSMCVAYSTLGLKEGEESQNAILMLIWAFKHFEMQTPLLVHENVAGFASQSLKEEAFHKGYDHFEIRSKPIDFGVHVGRARKYLAGRSGSNSFVCIYSNATLYIHLEPAWLKHDQSSSIQSFWKDCFP